VGLASQPSLAWLRHPLPHGNASAMIEAPEHCSHCWAPRLCRLDFPEGHTGSETQGSRCGLLALGMQVGNPKEEDLKAWGQHSSLDTVPDPILQRVGDEHITFVFSCQVAGKLAEEPSPVMSDPRTPVRAQPPPPAPRSDR
jgi:hypothetical protein